MEKLKTGMLLFPGVTIQDFIGPYEVFIRAACFEVIVIGASTAPLQAEGGLQLIPAVAFEDCPQLDILFVPGGQGINALLTDNNTLRFLRRQGKKARYITSVCTGALVLAAAGLLDGYKATTHWRSLELLRRMGIETIEQRVVTDRNRITGGGVTAGLDFGLALTAAIGGEAMAQTIQLLLEYEPDPPFHCGSPARAGAALLSKARSLTQAVYDTRAHIISTLPPTEHR